MFWLCLKIRVRRTLKWCIDELIKHIECRSTDVECRFLISACLSVLKLLCSVWVEPSGTEHVSGEHSSMSPRYGTCQHRGCLRSCSKPWINSVCSTLCLKKLGRHFRPVWTLLPFILNGELDPVSALCVQAVVLPWRSLWGELFRTPTDTHSRCITSLHKYFTVLWSKLTSVSPCLANCFGWYTLYSRLCVSFTVGRLWDF